MYDIQKQGNRMIIDLREAILGGAHPRHDMFTLIKEADIGTILEIYTPRYPRPLVKGFEDLGLTVTVDEITPTKIRVVAEKYKATDE